MVAIWRYSKFITTYSFIRSGEYGSENTEVKKIEVKRLSPFVSDSIESSILCEITSDSARDAQDVLGKLVYNIVRNLSFIGELILFLLMAVVLGLIIYFLFSALSGKFVEIEMLYMSVISMIIGLTYTLYLSKHVDRLLFVSIPIRRGWIPLDYLRNKIDSTD